MEEEKIVRHGDDTSKRAVFDGGGIDRAVEGWWCVAQKTDENKRCDQYGSGYYILSDEHKNFKPTPICPNKTLTRRCSKRDVCTCVDCNEDGILLQINNEMKIYMDRFNENKSNYIIVLFYCIFCSFNP